jgi:hypothetical protein
MKSVYSQNNTNQMMQMNPMHNQMNNMQNMPNMQNQMMSNMQNIPSMFSMGMMKNIVFDPKKIDDRYKRTLISMNISQSRSGWYTQIQKHEHMPFAYTQKCDPGEINDICNVEVVYEHALDVAEKYADHGFPKGFTKMNKMNPVILNIVGKEFIGTGYESSENMRDEVINIRTNFCVCSVRSNVFPIKDNQCVHTDLVTVIRPKDPRMGQPLLPWPKLYRTGIITASPIKQEENTKQFTSDDMTNTLITIECIFQCAIAHSHHVLILTPFGNDEDNNPIEDIIKIYNYCIMMYGHRFKHIIIAIPPHYPKGIYEIYQEEIIKPNKLTQTIEDKYDGIENEKKMKAKLQEKLKQNNTSQAQYKPITKKNKKKSNADESESDENNNAQLQNQMQQFMQMMTSNPAMMSMMANNMKK